MAKTILLARKGNALFAADADSESYIMKLKQGDVVKAQVTRPRSIKQHRLLWSILNEIIKHQPEPEVYKDSKQLLKALKIATGHFEVLTTIEGHKVEMPLSIDFASLPQDEFNEWFNRALDIIFKHILPHDPVLQDHILTMMKEPNSEIFR